MIRLTPENLFRTRLSRRKAQLRKRFRAHFEALEDRTILNAGATMRSPARGRSSVRR
jgi:hypothetical protein